MRLASFCSAQSPEGQFFGTFQKALAHAEQRGHVFRGDDSKLTLARKSGLPDGWEATKHKSGAIYCKVSERSEQAL